MDLHQNYCRQFGLIVRLQVTDKSTMSTTVKLARSTSQTLAKQGRKLDLENYCAPGVRDLWMPALIFVLNVATILLGIYRLDKVSLLIVQLLQSDTVNWRNCRKTGVANWSGDVAPSSRRLHRAALETTVPKIARAQFPTKAS